MLKKAVAIPLLCCALSACVGALVPTPKASATYSGTLVDGTTGKPVEGAVVIATWHDFTPNYSAPIFHQGGSKDYSCYQLVNVESAVTGPDGRYALPGWAGKLGHCQSMNLWQPNIIYYKPGYATLTSFQGDEGYTPGSDFTATGADGGVIPMRPLGPHRFTNGDNHVLNLSRYAQLVGAALEEDKDGPCFWKEAAPTLLMIFQEERRLAEYAPNDADFIDGEAMDTVTGRRCSDPAAVAALKEQAMAVQPEQPLLPYIQQTSLRMALGQAVLPTRELQGYVQAERAAGHAEDAKSVIYHLRLDPADPYYMSVLSIGSSYAGGALPDANTLARDGVSTMSCTGGTQAEAAAVPSRSYVYGSNGAMAIVMPSSPSGSTPRAASRPAAGAPVTAMDRQCQWAAALGAKDMTLDDEVTANTLHRDVYDAASGTWILTEHGLVRARESEPEFLEIHGSEHFSVATTLAPAGPNRWRLPPAGTPFTLAVTTASAGAGPGVEAARTDTDEACSRLLPDTLKLRVAREFAAFDLQRVSEAPGTAGACTDVVSGDFDGSGTTSYAFHLIAYGAIQRLVVAKPQGTGWNLTLLNPPGCLDIKTCTLRPLAAGKYRRSTRQWLDPDGPHRYPVDYSGQPDSLEASHPGFIEDWKEPIAYVYFYINGEWVSLSVDGSVRSLEFPLL